MTKSDNKILVIKYVKELRSIIASKRGKGMTIGLVPTMGALHEGHLSLVEEMQRKADFIVTVIFVNPTQFGKGEDFDSYPKKEAEDIKKLQKLGSNCVFIPTIDEIYSGELKTKVLISDLTDVLCGASRPGHFGGVALIVMKLFMMVLPDYAIFGKKDYQQLVIIKQMVNDLNIPIKIMEGEILRQDDGLALSSRNDYLDNDEKQVASQLNVVLKNAATAIRSGGDIPGILNNAKDKLIELGFCKIDYLEVRLDMNLELIEKYTDQQGRLFAAAFIGKTRLIDNIEI